MTPLFAEVYHCRIREPSRFAKKLSPRQRVNDSAVISQTRKRVNDSAVISQTRQRVNDSAVISQNVTIGPRFSFLLVYDIPERRSVATNSCVSLFCLESVWPRWSFDEPYTWASSALASGSGSNPHTQCCWIGVKMYEFLVCRRGELIHIAAVETAITAIIFIQTQNLKRGKSSLFYFQTFSRTAHKILIRSSISECVWHSVSISSGIWYHRALICCDNPWFSLFFLDSLWPRWSYDKTYTWAATALASGPELNSHTPLFLSWF